jgi:hypothetical protein
MPGRALQQIQIERSDIETKLLGRGRRNPGRAQGDREMFFVLPCSQFYPAFSMRWPS